MRAISNVVAMTVAIAVLALWVGGTRAEEAKAAKAAPSPNDLIKALAEAGKPGAEHKKLEPFVGAWTFTMKIWTDPSQPPAELKGTIERKWILGGRFVQERVKGEASGRSFEARGLLASQNAEKKFTAVRACGLCGTTAHHLLTADAGGTKFTCTTEDCCPVTGRKFTGRDEVVI